MSWVPAVIGALVPVAVIAAYAVVLAVRNWMARRWEL